jgi:hypothetical protein
MGVARVVTASSRRICAIDYWTVNNAKAASYVGDATSTCHLDQSPSFCGMARWRLTKELEAKNKTPCNEAPLFTTPVLNCIY